MVRLPWRLYDFQESYDCLEWVWRFGELYLGKGGGVINAISFRRVTNGSQEKPCILEWFGVPQGHYEESSISSCHSRPINRIKPYFVFIHRRNLTLQKKTPPQYDVLSSPLITVS